MNVEGMSLGELYEAEGKIKEALKAKVAKCYEDSIAEVYNNDVDLHKTLKYAIEQWAQKGAVLRIDTCIEERIKRLGDKVEITWDRREWLLVVTRCNLVVDRRVGKTLNEVLR